MSRPTLAALLLLLCPAIALARASDAPATAEQQDPQSAYNDLVKGIQKAVTDWRKEAMAAVREAQKEGKPIPAIAMSPPTKKYIERAQALALEHAGEDAAVQFHAFVFKYASNEREAVKKSVLTLTMDHAESQAIVDALPFVGAAVRHGVKKEVLELFDEVIEFNASNEAKAQALIARGSMRLEMAGSDEDRKIATADLERVASVTEDKDLIAQAEDALFEVRHLQVGCEAPEITASDVDGVAFKLSDYRGKVVLLDFWGFW